MTLSEAVLMTIGMSAGYFMGQFVGRQDYAKAVDASYYTGVTLLVVWLGGKL